jgi:hypothetical protein
MEAVDNKQTNFVAKQSMSERNTISVFYNLWQDVFLSDKPKFVRQKFLPLKRGRYLLQSRKLNTKNKDYA